MTQENPVDYAAVLADLKQKRDRLDAAIAGIEAMLGLGGSTGTEGQTVRHQTHERPATLGPGAFLGMTIVDAAKKYLAFKRQNQRTEEILKALKDGGVVLSAKAPANVVASVLNRNWVQGGDIVKVGRGIWGLSEWHPRLRKKNGSDAKNGSSVGDDEGGGDVALEDPEADGLDDGVGETPSSEASPSHVVRRRVRVA